MDKKIYSNGYDYVDLGLPSRTLQATCNVGADKPFEYVITNMLELETVFKPSLKSLIQRTKWQKHQD